MILKWQLEDCSFNSTMLSNFFFFFFKLDYYLIIRKVQRQTKQDSNIQQE